MQVLDAKSSSLSHSPTICEPGSSDLSGRQGEKRGEGRECLGSSSGFRLTSNSVGRNESKSSN